MKEYHLKAVMDWTEDSIYLFATPSLMAKSMVFFIQELGHFKTLPRYSTEREHLNSYLVVYTLSGTGYLKYEHKEYTLHTGDAFFIDCDQYQYYETDRNDLWEFLWIHFDGGLSANYYTMFRELGGPVLSLSPSSNVPETLYGLIQMNRNKDARTELMSSNLITNLLTELILQRVHHEWKTDSKQMPDFIVKVVNYIEKHFAEKILLGELSSLFSVSKYHLIREFKKYMGSTPNEYLISTRLTKAKELLKYSGLSVAEISNQIGFESVTHFINTFKKQEQMTPLSYRKQWKDRLLTKPVSK